MEKIRLLDLDTHELEEFVASKNLPKYRAKQIAERLTAGASFEEMTNLSKDVRAMLAECAVTGIPEVADVKRSQLDGTVKFLFEQEDGVLVESVLMKYSYGYSVCISSQAGCKMGCKFCASAGIPFSRSLSAGEILGQVIAVQKHENVRIGHIVIMGIGEPLDNYDNVVKFLRRVTADEGLNVGARKISVSTCGIVPKIYTLADEKLPVTLSVSLHNPFDSERSKIMPINKKYPLDELFEACRYYTEKTKRRITFEYALIAGVNDSKRHADELAARMKKLKLCHVNLIPVNKVSGTGFERPDRKNIERFAGLLDAQGVSVTVRRELGRDIDAACGQLRKQTAEERKAAEAAKTAGVAETVIEKPDNG
ncbi:MAG: 23S rRNA (adenine(2503)-C(2))-methyltransferase RlmN [Clostridia bacterium]|nr:23S rRNA (adenine(2503)-C(2))-methyltransferase RlmN [Clostridia bacterium]MBP5765821.1 23S rRNA (adenine(2503)-C(2))-methyltransferase RlmN [Clostridia bacterium]